MAKTASKITLPEDKQEIIEEFAQKKGDTGSPEVQVALLTHKITKLTDHLKIHQKDFTHPQSLPYFSHRLWGQ